MELLHQKDVNRCLKYVFSLIDDLQAMQLIWFYSNVLAEISKSF